MGVHDDRGAVLRERGELGRGEVPALRMVRGMTAQRGAVKKKKGPGGYFNTMFVLLIALGDAGSSYLFLCFYWI